MSLTILSEIMDRIIIGRYEFDINMGVKNIFKCYHNYLTEEMDRLGRSIAHIREVGKWEVTEEELALENKVKPIIERYSQYRNKLGHVGYTIIG